MILAILKISYILYVQLFIRLICNLQMGSPGMQPGPPNRGGRLDPDQMPSPIAVMDDDQRANGGNFDTKEKGQTPPLVTTKFTVNDYGNASPRYITLKSKLNSNQDYI